MKMSSVSNAFNGQNELDNNESYTHFVYVTWFDAEKMQQTGIDFDKSF